MLVIVVHNIFILIKGNCFVILGRPSNFSLDLNNRNTIRAPRPLPVLGNDLANHHVQRGNLRLSFEQEGIRPVVPPPPRPQPPPLQDRTR